MSDDILNEFDQELRDLGSRGLRRDLLPLRRIGPARARLADGREALLLCGNDYLGLASDERLIAAVQQGAAHWGAGAGASRLVSGSLEAHHLAETALAGWKGAGAALLFGSGFLANLGIIGALTSRGDAVLCDRLNHASLIDAARLSGAALLPYRHGDAGHAADMLRKRRTRYRRLIIATDSVFSMDGDMAPLDELLTLAEEHDALLLADEAHALGVMGAQGRGVVEHLGLPGDHPRLIQMGTLSKAAGLYGAYAAAARPIIEMIVNRGRSFIYSTALAPALAHAVPVALELIVQAGEARRHLLSLGERLHGALRRQGWSVAWHGTPILPLATGSATEALRLQARLLEKGVLAVAIRPPSVPRGGSRLRLSLSAAHSESDIDCVIGAFEQLSGEMRP